MRAKHDRNWKPPVIVSLTVEEYGISWLHFNLHKLKYFLVVFYSLWIGSKLFTDLDMIDSPSPM